MLTAVGSPQAEVNMRAAAGLIEERLGSKGSEQIERTSYATGCLTYETDIIGSTQNISMVNREFLLCGAEFCVEQLDGDSLRFQRLQNSIYHFGLFIKSDAAVAEAAVGGNVFTTLLASKIEFVFDSGFGTYFLIGQPCNHAFEESTRACFPWFAVREDNDAKHMAGAGKAGQ